MTLLDWLLLVLGGGALIFSLRFYARLLTEIRDRGALVQSHYLGFPETLIASVLLVFLLASMIAAFLGVDGQPVEPPDVSKMDMIQQALAMAMIPASLIFFMAYRRVRLERLYGLEGFRLLPVVGAATGLLIGALPLVLLANVISQMVIQVFSDEVTKQLMVDIFQKAATSRDYSTIWKIAFSAVIIAPISEEILFRGFFYPVLKRHLGGIWGALITSIVFALVHNNVASILGLTVLALVLTIAYERTGSLVVNIIMHALFNAVSLFYMWMMFTHEPMKVSKIGEDALVSRLTQNLPSAPDVRVGPGSDCAIIGKRSAKEWLVLKTDCVVESVHFSPQELPERVGWKALCRAISDVAACGGLPTHALVTLAVASDESVERLDGIYRGLRKAARRFGVSIVGGETSRSPGPLFVNVALSGKIEPQFCVSRTGGRAGDLLYVTGKLGGSLSGKHLDFLPRLPEARWLVQHFRPKAMMDLSDGLGRDLPRLAAASRCGFELNLDVLPLSRGCTRDAGLSDGEDFELLFAISRKMGPELEKAWRRKFPRLLLTCVGRLHRNSIPSTRLTSRGFDHFA